MVSKDFGAAGPQDFVEILFQDSGEGIEADVMDNIFEPFFTTSTGDNRPGLGLAISYGIIQDHGGVIEANSDVGQGTTFAIYLPVERTTEEPN